MYHCAIKRKLVDVISSTYIDFNNKNNEKYLKLVIMLKHLNIKTFLQNFTFQIDLKKFLTLKKFKIL